MQLNHDFPETSVASIGERLRTVDVSYNTATNRFSRGGIMVGRSPRFNDGGPDAAMWPGGRAKRVVMPEHESHIDIHPPAVTDKLGTHNLPSRVVMGHCLGKRDLVFTVLGRVLVGIGTH